MKGLKKPEVEKIKNDILGKQYELSFAFISKNKIKSLNKKYRKKDEPTDILSFPLDKDSGEILICKTIAKTKAPKFGKTLGEYLLFLVIHGIFHLKGLRHGAKMEAYELTHYSRYRHRYLRSARSRGGAKF
jgi:probable rRNA maturation factor